MAAQHILLTIQRQVLGELADHDIGQQSGPSQAARDRIGRRLGRRHTVFAAGAGVFRVDVPQYPQLAGLVFELLGHVLADPGLLAAAVTDPLLWGDVMGDVLPGQMVGNLSAAVPLLSFARGQLLGRRGIGRFIEER